MVGVSRFAGHLGVSAFEEGDPSFQCGDLPLLFFELVTLALDLLVSNSLNIAKECQRETYSMIQRLLLTKLVRA